MKIYHKFNFFKHTYCEFEEKPIDFLKDKAATYKSKSGSLYYYADDGVYRYSNHWGRVANCRWKIKGVVDFKSQNYYVGFAKWESFYPLNDTDKVFYITVNYQTKQAKIIRLTTEDSSTLFLMTAEFAHQRLKQVQTLFKEYKWAKYFNEDIEVLQQFLIGKMLSTTKSLQALKQELKREFA